MPRRLKVSTNIGEMQDVWSTAAQATLGVVVAGADIVKVGLAHLSAEKAARLMSDIARQMKFFFPRPHKSLIVTLFDQQTNRSITKEAEARIYVWIEG